MDTRDATIQLMRDLYASDNGLLPYTLYKRYGVTPIVLAQIVKRLQRKGFVRLVKDNRLLLTDEGKEKTEGYVFRLINQKKTRVESEYFMNISTNTMKTSNGLTDISSAKRMVSN